MLTHSERLYTGGRVGLLLVRLVSKSSFHLPISHLSVARPFRGCRGAALDRRGAHEAIAIAVGHAGRHLSVMSVGVVVEGRGRG